MMFTLRQADEIRKMSAIDEGDQVPDEVNDAEIKLAKQVIGNFEGELELSEFKDEYQSELRKSLDTVSASKKRAARATKVTRTTTLKRKRTGWLLSREVVRRHLPCVPYEELAVGQRGNVPCLSFECGRGGDFFVTVRSCPD